MISYTIEEAIKRQHMLKITPPTNYFGAHQMTLVEFMSLSHITPNGREKQTRKGTHCCSSVHYSLPQTPHVIHGQMTTRMQGLLPIYKPRKSSFFNSTGCFTARINQLTTETVAWLFKEDSSDYLGLATSLSQETQNHCLEHSQELPGPRSKWQNLRIHHL